VTLLQSANDHLLDAVRMCETDDFELIATDIRAALDGLGRITGRTMQPDILDNIFSKFCIGK
jgi:tRNA modification GTPase